MSAAVRVVEHPLASRDGRELAWCAVAVSSGVTAGAEEVGGDAGPAPVAQRRPLHVDDTTRRFRNLAALRPDHTPVVPAGVVWSPDRMLTAADAGRAGFHDFHGAAERAVDPSRRQRDLCVLRGTPGAPFARIAPGAGLAQVASLREGFPDAHERSTRGNHAFVRKDRAERGGQVATEELAAVLPRPAAVVPLHAGHARIALTAPPTFGAVGEDDRRAAPAVMERRVVMLRRSGTDTAYRRYPGAGHRVGLGLGTSAEGRIGNAMRFWTEHIDPREPNEERVR